MVLNEDAQSLPPGIARCIENLKNPNPRQRSQAALELGELKALEAVPALIATLNDDVNTYVRSAAAESLGHLGDPRSIFPLMDALHDSSSFVRRATAIALGQLQAKEAQVALLQALDDPNFYVQRAVINAIGKLGIPDLGSVLLPFLDTDDPRIRRTVVTALRRMGTHDAVSRMVTMLEEYMRAPAPHDLPVVKTLILALGDFRSQEAVPVLLQVVQGYVGVRSLAASALGHIGDHRAGPVLVEALKDRSASLRLAALKGLGRLGYVKAAPTIREFFSSPDPRMRRVSALAAGQLRDHEAIPHLLEMLHNDSSPLVRPVAAEALALIGDPQVLSELLPLVEDSNAYLRASLGPVLCTLGTGSPGEVRHALELLQEDKVEHVAAAARRSLERLAEIEAAPESIPAFSKECMEPKGKETSWLRRLFNMHL
ncbi:MAG: HEAT repeat domain-containing protein [Anaerolineae bacterium]|nr:HEAT repeat domain-containing protein [Anaerolineae bacterium]